MVGTATRRATLRKQHFFPKEVPLPSGPAHRQRLYESSTSSKRGAPSVRSSQSASDFTKAAPLPKRGAPSVRSSQSASDFTKAALLYKRGTPLARSSTPRATLRKQHFFQKRCPSRQVQPKRQRLYESSTSFQKRCPFRQAQPNPPHIPQKNKESKKKMQVFSPYPEMTKDASLIPENAAAKLFMRHSIRFDNPPNGDYSQLMLTPEGIELAQKIGQSIDRPIGNCASSKVQRCQQTIDCILQGHNQNQIQTNIQNPGNLKNSKSPIEKNIIKMDELSSCLGDPRAEESGGVGWYNYFHYLQTANTQGSRGITLQMETKRLLDAIFSLPSRPATLDIICSHDSHVVILASALFNLKTGTTGQNWCRYTEGLFFYGPRENFTALWRGHSQTFTNYLL